MKIIEPNLTYIRADQIKPGDTFRVFDNWDFITAIESSPAADPSRIRILLIGGAWIEPFANHIVEKKN